MPCETTLNEDNDLTATSDLVRRDNGIPGLGLLLDPARLLDELREYMDISRVDDIKLDYLRYKPAMNCLARYQLSIDGCTITAYAKAHAEDAVYKIGKSMERPVFDGILGPGRVVLKEPQIIFSTFPNDSKLASLQCISDENYRRRVFGRLFGPDSRWQNSRLGEALNYKPERRYVVRLTRSDGESALVKFYSTNAYAKARTISRKLAGSRQGFYPETIGRSKKYSAVAYHWQSGKTLRQLNILGKLGLSDLAATAESLAEFHTSGKQGLSPPGPAEQVERLRALAEYVGVLLPGLELRARHAAKQLMLQLDQQTPVRQPVHGDFYDKQAIANNGAVRLIDLDAARLDNPLLDLGNYIAHLERRVGRQDLSISEVETQKNTLIREYERLTGSIHEDQLNQYIALGLFGLIHQPFRDWSRDWPAETEQLLARVESLCAS